MAFNAAIRKSFHLLNILPVAVASKPIYSSSYCICNNIPSSLLGGTTTGLRRTRHAQSLLKLPWSSLLRSFYNKASTAAVKSNPTPTIRLSSYSWTPLFRYSNKLDFKKTWASLPPLFLAFPLFLPASPLVHCEGGSSSGPRPKPSTRCGCDLELPEANCGPSCDRLFLPPQPPDILPPPPTEQNQNLANPNCPPSTCPSSACPPVPVPSTPPPQPSIPTSDSIRQQLTNDYGLSPVNWCETPELSHKFLVRQASQLSVDSVTRIMCETISAYQDYHEKYRCLLDALIDALENSRSSDGVQLELLDCRIIMMRAEVDNMKGRILELEGFMGSVQRLSEAAAETAFLGGAEYHSLAMSERLDSVLREMKAIKEESCRKERDMIELQSVVIIEAGKGLK